jgi:hypothetical protein
MAPKDSRISTQLQAKHEANYEGKTVTITYGYDFVNLVNVHFVARSVDVAKASIYSSLIFGPCTRTQVIFFSS